jgi:hypothetical protein
LESTPLSTHTVAETPAELVNRAAGTITDAARRQQDTEPDHRDMYSLALAVERALDALFAVNGNLGGQLAHYGEGRHLRTDTDRGPAEVLAAAMGYGQTPGRRPATGPRSRPQHGRRVRPPRRAARAR